MTLRMFRVALSVCLLFSILCLCERPAHAYVDPGSGLVLYQTLSATIVGILFHFRRRINLLLGRDDRTKIESETGSTLES